MSLMDTLGIEPRASRMLSGCDTTTPCALCRIHLLHMAYEFIPRTIECTGHYKCRCLLQEMFLASECIIITQLLDMDTPGIEPRASRMRSGCDTTTQYALGIDETIACIEYKQTIMN